MVGGISYSIVPLYLPLKEGLMVRKNGMMVGGYYHAIFSPFYPFNIKYLELCFFSLSFSIFALCEGKRGPGLPFKQSLVNYTHIA